MNTLLRIIVYLLFLLIGAYMVFAALLSGGIGFGHGGGTSSSNGLLLMGGVALLVTAVYAIIRRLGKAEVSASGSARIRFTRVDLGVVVVVWIICLLFGALIG